MHDLQQQKKRADELRADHEAHKEAVTKRTGELQTAHDALQIRATRLETNHQFVRGMIIAWSGSIASIPYGWRLCEALKDRFILGAGGSYGVGTTGGKKEHTLTVEEMPSHNHAPGFSAGKGNGLKASGGNAVDRDQGNMSASEWTQSAAGGNKPHNNMPPYYALAYIEYVG